MYFESGTTTYSGHPNAVALIPRMAADTTVVIKNLGVDNAYVNYKNTAAAFIGNGMGNNIIDISNSYVGEQVTLKGGTAAAFRGYAYQKATSTTMTNCYSLASMTGASGVGFVATQNDYISGTKTVKFVNCYNANGPLNSGNNFGSVATATNCYATEIGGTGNQLKSGVTTLLAAQMQGANALTVMPLGDAYTATDSYPVLKVFPVKTPTTPDEPDEPVGCAHTYYDEYHAYCLLCGEERDVEARPIEVWNKSTTQPTVIDKDGNILIGKASELAYIIANGGGAANKYKLIADIYLNDVDKVDWTTGVAAEGYTANAWYDHGKTFQGTIDGDGHIIYGLYQNVTGSSSGLYGCGLVPKVNASESVVIKNLGVEKSYIKSHSSSAFVGVSGNNSSVIIDKCYVGESVTLIAGRDAGAFGGRIQGSITVTDSYSLATIEGGNSNGLLGDVWAKSTITNCYNAKGAISYGTNTSYFVTATNCYAIAKSQSADGTHVMKTPTVITADEMKGENTVMALGDAYATTNGYPTLKVFNK